MTIARVLEMFDRSVASRNPLLAALTDEIDSVGSEARAFLEAMAADLAYIDKPHPFRDALFYCAINLALFKSLEKRGIGVHTFGGAMLSDLANRTGMLDADGEDSEAAGMVEFPQRGDHPGEFEVEMVQPEAGDESFTMGYNVKFCAICYLFSQHDAMALVPYMCASDDVVSDAQSQGLKRTGTIALGAHCCDFRFGGKGESRRVAEQYPDNIRFVHS